MPAKLVKRQGDVDLSDWNFSVVEVLGDKLRLVLEHAVKESIDAAMSDKDTYATMAGAWSDDDGRGDGAEIGDEPRHPVEPLTVHLNIAIGEEDVTYAFDIREDIEHRIRECAADGSYDAGLRRMMHAFRAIADDIERELHK